MFFKRTCLRSILFHCLSLVDMKKNIYWYVEIHIKALNFCICCVFHDLQCKKCNFWKKAVVYISKTHLKLNIKKWRLITTKKENNRKNPTKNPQNNNPPPPQKKDVKYWIGIESLKIIPQPLPNPRKSN